MAGDSFGFIGSTLDQNYRIDGVLGEGGFGVVYRGWHLAFDEPVAVKCLKVPPHFTAEARQLFEQRFRDEGKLLRKLGEHHPAVVKAHDVRILHSLHGHIPSVPYLVLELLEGDTLDVLLRRRLSGGHGPFSESEAIQLLAPVMEALDLAHRGELGQVIAHRDIKPENVFVLRDGRVKLLDFGIAKAMHDGEQKTQQQSRTSSGFSAFSPPYGAPEQFSAKKYGESGPWTDVHALGLVLAEMVSGRCPYGEGEYADLLLAAIAPERPTPRKQGAKVSDGFEVVCARALALRASERFPHAGDLLRALQACAPAHPQPGGNAVVPGLSDSRPGTRLPVETFHPGAKGPIPPHAAPPSSDPAPSTQGRGTSMDSVHTYVPPVAEPGPTTTKGSRGALPLLLGAGVLVLGMGGWMLSRGGWGEGENHSSSPHTTGGAVASVASAPPVASMNKQDEKTPVPPENSPTPKELELGLKPPPGKPSGEARPESGAMVKLEGGTFQMGSNDRGDGEKPVHEVKVATFWMDVTEVTVAAYKACVDAGSCSKPDNGEGCNWGRSDRSDHPINCVDWSQATTFCRWANKRLPTEEEWEFAARGSKGGKYPWGDAEPSNQLCWDGDGNDLGKGNRKSTCRVGSYPSGNTPTGLKDMAGNVSEWTSSLYCPYAVSGYDVGKCDAFRVNRDDGWNIVGASYVRGAHRLGLSLVPGDNNLGFRCARADLFYSLPRVGHFSHRLVKKASWNVLRGCMARSI